jgi:hypothetical protein
VILPKDAEIVAHRGSPDYLLIKTGNDGEHDLGRVWRRGFPLFPEMYVAAIAKFGYWEEYEGSQGLLVEIEKELEDYAAREKAARDAAARDAGSGDRGTRPPRKPRRKRAVR